jgi:N-terminal half of MaoC dehydratase
MVASKFPVEAGAILLFARSVGDPNPVYSDAEYASATEVGGIIAPPTFVQSSAQFDPDYPLRPKPGEKWFGSGRNPTGRSTASKAADEGSAEGAQSGGTGLHAEQEFTYHRPVRPGDVLIPTLRPGNSWEKQGRSGRLVFSESITEYRDQQGEPVVTARSVGVRTERPVSKENR